MSRAKQWAIYGGIGGVAAPTVITKAPKFVKGAVERGVTQVQDYASSLTLGQVSDTMRSKAAEKEQKGKSTFVTQAVLNLAKPSEDKKRRRIYYTRPTPTNQQTEDSQANSQSQVDAITGE